MYFITDTLHINMNKSAGNNKTKAKLERKRNNSSMPQVTLDLEERAAGLT